MGDVSYMETYIAYHPFVAMCVNCYRRWIAVVPDEIILKTVECEACGPGYVIDTGQYITDLDRNDTKPNDGIPRDYAGQTVGSIEPGENV